MINETSPLAERLRPQDFDQIVGQAHILGEKGPLTRIIKKKKPVSLLLWGPPGCGKTTVAKIYAKSFNAPFFSFSAVFHGISDIKNLIEDSASYPLLQSSPKIVFVDEIHRFSKTQQDVFLPFIENGTLILIGATTENPSFSLTGALLSRLQVFALHPLNREDLSQILSRFEKREKSIRLTKEARELLLSFAQGDGRYLLNMVESLEGTEEVIDEKKLEEIVQRRASNYDKNTDIHHNLISALHKSVRGSDPDASLYWLARMLEGGEPPLYLSRRLIRMAIEDVGLADPEALSICLNASKAYELLGSPEADLALAEAVVYLALAPKSNSIYTAFKKARELASTTTHLSPPSIILNAPTAFMKNLGYSKGYLYDHDLPNGFSGQNYFPDGLERPSFYDPIDRGFEREMHKRLDYFAKLRESMKR